MSAWAATIVGTSKNDVLKGSPEADRLFGKEGADKLYGYGGNDLLAGGPGADLLSCGPGRDTALADAKDKTRKDCEIVKGLPSPSPKPKPKPKPKPPPPPPQPPPSPPPPIRAGRYVGTTQQNRPIEFDVRPELTRIENGTVRFDVACMEVSSTLTNLGITFAIPIRADRSFGGPFTFVDEGDTFNGFLLGSFDGSGAAVGSIRVDLTVTNVQNVGTVHCSTGNLSWSAR